MSDWDEYVGRLKSVAAQLSGRVRDDTPDEFEPWLAQQRPESVDATRWYRDLCVVLACAVPDDQTFKTLTAWTEDPIEWRFVTKRLSPCGTSAAAWRHRKAGEPLCEPCIEAERANSRRKYAMRMKRLRAQSRPQAVGDVVDGAAA